MQARCQEPDCNGSQVLTTWADQISQYIKSIDSNHVRVFGVHISSLDRDPEFWDMS